MYDLTANEKLLYIFIPFLTAKFVTEDTEILDYGRATHCNIRIIFFNLQIYALLKT